MKTSIINDIKEKIEELDLVFLDGVYGNYFSTSIQDDIKSFLNDLNFLEVVQEEMQDSDFNTVYTLKHRENLIKDKINFKISVQNEIEKTLNIKKNDSFCFKSSDGKLNIYIIINNQICGNKKDINFKLSTIKNMIYDICVLMNIYDIGR